LGKLSEGGETSSPNFFPSATKYFSIVPLCPKTKRDMNLKSMFETSPVYFRFQLSYSLILFYLDSA
jgi:hypothetical protein